MTTGNRVFTEAQRELLSAVINRIVPADGRMPGAGDLGVAAFIEDVVAKNIGLRRLFLEGLTRVDIASVNREGKPFLELPDAARDETLREVEQAGATFFQELVSQTYNGYYTNPQVFALMGYSPPDPETYQPEPFDESLLEKQRQRAPFWRRV